MPTDRSRLGEESLDEGLDDRDREDLGLVGGPAESSESGKDGSEGHEFSVYGLQSLLTVGR